MAAFPGNPMPLAARPTTARAAALMFRSQYPIKRVMAAQAQWYAEADKVLLETGGRCRFVARQPILDRLRKTHGYELLFRTSWENRFCGDGEAASRHMLDNAVSFGMDSMVGTAVPFVNCTRSLLLARMPTVLPVGTVLEVLEDAEVDKQMIAACRELRALGYGIALDDYDFHDRWEMLIPFASHIKLDFRASTLQQRAALMYRLKYHSIKFVAEKVETQEEYAQAMSEGFHLFQGYFFMRPVVMARGSLTTLVNKLRFLAELSSTQLDRPRILRLLKEEPSISYRVLRMANSVAISAREPVKSLECAMSLIGDLQFRRLATLALATEFTGGLSLEPIRMILQRAHFCELVADNLSMEPGEMYLMGMMSIVRKTLRLEDNELAGPLRLRPDVAAALSGTPNEYFHLLRLAESLDRGDWETMAACTDALRLDEGIAAQCMEASRRWAENILELAQPI